jgi:hypothetical protein
MKLALSTKQAGAILGITSNGVLHLEKEGLLTDISPATAVVSQALGAGPLGRHSHAYDPRAVAQLKQTYIRGGSAATNRALAAQAATGNGTATNPTTATDPTTAVVTSRDGIFTRLGHLDRRVAELAQAVERLTRLWQ